MAFTILERGDIVIQRDERTIYFRELQEIKERNENIDATEVIPISGLNKRMRGAQLLDHLGDYSRFNIE